VVKTIEHDYNANNFTYKNNVGQSINENKAVVKEGDKINLTVNDYNPLSIDVSASKVKGSLYYQQNNSSALLNFLKVDNSSSEKPGEEAKSMVVNSESKIDPIEQIKIGIMNTINHYKGFYNSIATLNNYLEAVKSFRKLDSNCLCDDLANYLKNIKELFISTSSTAIHGKCETSICKDLISGTIIIKEKETYFKKFNEFINQLEVLNATQKQNFIAQNEDIEKNRKIEIETETKGKKKSEIIKIKDKINKKYDAEKTKLIQKNDFLLNIIVDLTKELNDLKVDYLTTRSNNIDLAVNKYQSLGFIEFNRNLGSFRVEEEDNFTINLSFTNLVTSKTSERNVDLDVIKPLKIDYSGGVFVAPKLYDESFDIVKKTDTTYTINVLNKGKVSYGAIGYINFHPIFVCRGFSLGGSIGTGLMFNDASKIVFSPAFSIFLGRYQRVVLSIGGAFAQVDRVHSIYPNNEFKDANYKPELKSEISKSLIYSLSWNLNRK